MEARSEFARRLESLCLQAGSVHQVAGEIHVADHVIAQSVRGRHLPSGEVMLRIYHAYPAQFPEFSILEAATTSAPTTSVRWSADG